MKRYTAISILLLAAIALLSSMSCSSKVKKKGYVILDDGKYDSEFPSRSATDHLKNLSEMVKRISSIAFYEGYVFLPEGKVTLAEVKNGSYEQKINDRIAFSNSSAGTATTIFLRGKKIAVLTCAHVVFYPDTVVTYFKDDVSDSVEYVESFSIKKRQKNFLVDLAQGADFKILAMDRDADLAILGKDLLYPPASKVPVFNYKIGSAKELNWGDFVYLIGWPKGYKMVTRAIVSSPNRDRKHSFLIDALFNRGFSGGIVVAIRDGIPNFELVGIVSSVSASFEHTIVPDKNIDVSKFDPKLPYTGDLFVKFDRKIDYGITYGISVETIFDFIKEHEAGLKANGFFVSEFFSEKL